MAFPVFKAVPNSGQNDSHHIFTWKVVQDLQAKVAKYGINCPEVMQLIHVINATVLAPYGIGHLARILFQPAQYGVFQNTWRQLAKKQLCMACNYLGRTLVGVNALLGNGLFFTSKVGPSGFGTGSIIRHECFN